VPEPPYFAVIFTSIRSATPDDGYAETAARMEQLAREQPGFLGVESARCDDGLGITISYWESMEAIAAWGQHAEHLLAQKGGREKWYESYSIRVSRVESARKFTRTTDRQ
jgi:heme-degrading monooxygenase HmoA